MSAIKLIVFLLITAAFSVPLLFAGSLLRKKGSVLANILVFEEKVIALALLGLLLVYWDTAFCWQMNLGVAGLYAALFGSVIADNVRIAAGIVTWIVRKTGKKKASPDDRKTRICRWLRTNLGFRSRIRTEAVIIAAAFLYGVLNMMIVTPRTWTVTSGKLENSYRIVFVSDIHTGSAQPYSVVESTLENIRNEQPDLLVLGGDITDEYSTKEEAEWVWNKIGSLGIPSVFIWGNHDSQLHSDLTGSRSYTEEELREIITGNGVTILEEEYYELGPDLVLFGREDLSRPAKRTGMDPEENPSEDAFLVILDHQQLSGADLQDTGADLQLSGHSHAGQYFPLRLVYTLAKAYPSGLYRFGDSELIVSDGEAGWRSPFRTEGHSGYEVICLMPEE